MARTTATSSTRGAATASTTGSGSSRRSRRQGRGTASSGAIVAAAAANAASAATDGISGDMDSTIRAAVPSNLFGDGDVEMAEATVGAVDTQVGRYNHSGGMNWQTPKGFEFPSPSLESGWALWIFGLPNNKVTDSGKVVDAPVPPFRKLMPHSVPKSIRRTLRSWKSMYSLMDVGEVASRVNSVTPDTIKSTFLSETYQAGLEKVKSVASYAFDKPKWRTWTVCCWAGKITRSAMLRDGTEADKAKLPAATVLNHPKPAGSKRKRKKGSAVRNTFARRVAGSLLDVSDGSSGGESVAIDFGRPSSSAGSGPVAGGSAGSSSRPTSTGRGGPRPTGTSNNGSRSRVSTGGSNSGNDAMAMPVELEYDTVNSRFSNSACECCDSGMLTRHRCRVEDPNGRYFYRESQGSTMTLICGKAFCVKCQDRWNSESRDKCGDCLHLEIDERTKQQATAALANVGNERRQQKEFDNNDANAFFENIGM